MTPYSQNHAPPAPTSNIILRNVDSLEAVRNVPMLLDTGSDITLVSRSFCELIGVQASQTEFLEIQGFDGTLSVAYYVWLELIFLKKIFRGNFLVYDDPEGIIGRDILNKFNLNFDGPNLAWSEIKPRPNQY